MFEHDYSQKTGPWVLVAYATGNPETGIRNYALNRNPLHFGDIGYDTPGPEFHSDGEVWNAAMWEVRERLVAAWNGQIPLHQQAAAGPLRQHWPGTAGGHQRHR